MAYGEIEYYARLLGRERPDVRRLLHTARTHPKLSGAVLTHMRLLLRKQGLTPEEIPPFGPAETEIKDGVFAGAVMLGAEACGKLTIPVASFSEHTLVCGHSGSGKSYLIRLLLVQFVRRGIPVWVFDLEGEYEFLMKYPGGKDMLILTPENDRDNPLCPPEGVGREEWLAETKRLYRESFYFRDSSINLLDRIIRNLYSRKDSGAGSKNFPTIGELLRTLERLEFKPGTRHAGYLESLLNRFSALNDSLGPVVKCRSGYGIRELARSPVIFRTAGLSDDMRNFYINLKLLRLAKALESGGWGGLRIVVVIEEAHRLYNRKLAARYDLGEPMLFGNSRTFRKRGIGMIYSDQVPSQLPPALSGNINNFFVLRLVSGRCISRMASAMNLTREQAEFLPVLPRRHCVFQSSDYPDPVMVRIPELRFREAGKEEVQRKKALAPSRLSFVPYDEPGEGEPDPTETPRPPYSTFRTGRSVRAEREFANVWKEIASVLKERKYVCLSDLYAELGNLSPWFGRKAVRAMERRGLIETCQVNFGTRGNPKTFVILTEKGAGFAGADLESVRLRGKGSTEHVILQNIICESLREAGKDVRVEHSENGKSVDIAEFDGTRKVAYELELAPSHPHVAENARLDLEAGFDEVVIVTRNRTGQNEAKDRVYRSLDWQALSRVKFRLLREII